MVGTLKSTAGVIYRRAREQVGPSKKFPRFIFHVGERALKHFSAVRTVHATERVDGGEGGRTETGGHIDLAETPEVFAQEQRQGWLGPR